MTPFSIAFGGFLLSLVLWEQGVWHWSAMKIGLAIAPGPFMVPVTSFMHLHYQWFIVLLVGA
jgi:hypothetical protein